MSILNTLRFLETNAFYKSNLVLPKERIDVSHKGSLFSFYKPKLKTVRKYLESVNVYHNDLTVLGKVIMKHEKLLLVYMDLCYYGFSLSGYIFKLGRTIDSLSIGRGRRIGRKEDRYEREYCDYDYNEDEDDDGYSYSSYSSPDEDSGTTEEEDFI